MSCYILGLNAYHGDAAACLLRDGEVVAAIEEERLSRRKHQAGFPAGAVVACLAEAGIDLARVDHIAINRNPRGPWLRKLAYAATRMPSPALVLARLRNACSWLGVAESLQAACPGATLTGRVHHVDHHLAHLASAYYPSPFERALALSVDGFGDFASAAWATADEAGIRCQGRIHFPHSLGIFYQAMTQYLGFPGFGDEYKVMGLSAHGSPDLDAEVGQLVRIRPDGAFRLDLGYFRHHRENVAYEWSQGTPRVGRLYGPALEALLGPARSPDGVLEARHVAIAASVQAVYERAFYALVRGCARGRELDSLVLAGGCAQNSLANGRLTAETPIRRVYVPSAAADAGGALGAALVVWQGLGGDRRPARLAHAALGSSVTHEAALAAIATRQVELDAAGCRVEAFASVPVETVAALIDAGAVTGWVQGRMEWGPRALGNRSILADPRRAGMREVLNDKIKLREPFRPFAPSVLEEAVVDWFELPDPGDADSPFMARVYPVRADRRALVPAITHADGTGRVQSVGEAAEPAYRALIAAFARRTGVPMLLNTSFNENEPIVRTADEALDCFLRTRMDALVLGRVLIRRAGGTSAGIAPGQHDHAGA